MATLKTTTYTNGTGEKHGTPAVLSSNSPATGRHLGDVPITPAEQAPAVIERARRAQNGWFKAGLTHRLEMLRRVQGNIHRDMDIIISLIVAEQGKPPAEALSEFLASIDVVVTFIGLAKKTLAPRYVFEKLLPYRQLWVERRPFGVVLTISPWNFPVLLPLAPITAGLISGNTIVWKPSEYTPLTSQALAKCFWEAGIPHDVLQMVQGRGDLGAALVKAHPNKISFTGSVPTGRKIAIAAAEQLIPVQLELGAKDAAIILEDADLDYTVQGVIWAAMHNAGQACAAVERVYVHRSRMAEFLKKASDLIAQTIKVGPGEAPGTTMGAISNDMQMRVIESHVEEAVQGGAMVICGGKRIEGGAGRYFAPTILTDVTPDMKVVREETFGPIIVAIPFETDDEAIRLANDSPYGLSGSIWTRNKARGLTLASRLEVGHADVNDHILSATVPKLPWGFTKDTGYGAARGAEGLLGMTRPMSFSIPRFGNVNIPQLFWYPYTPLKYGFLRRLIRVLYAPSLRGALRSLFQR
ncbi:MAG TPA: aldehyde dehydrogenase family protein [Aggregatilineales bacterium]|nr:aldehyde dehydrogenase family protein [Anaerolineales bacterium]HRE48144.1 aldehyde dehydrogenase family protein [Aggregatilineales bacterium]